MPSQWDGHFRPLGLRNPRTDSLEICSHLIMSTVRPHMQNMVAAANGGWGVSIWVKLYPCVLFSFFSLFVTSTLPHLTLRSVDFRSMHPECVSVVGVFLWLGSPRGQIIPFLLAKKRFNGPIKVIIWHGS